jgi:hypothetical protein
MIPQRRLYPERVLEYHEKGKISDELLRSFYERLPILEAAVRDVEHASKLEYPPIIIDPTLTIVRYPASTFSSTIIYASTKVNRISEIYRLCVAVSLPFLLYARTDTLRACVAHEFLHYIYSTIVLDSKSFMSLSSERLDAPEAYIAFDETHSVVPEEWLAGAELADLIKKTFKPIIEDRELETAIKENWIERGLPIRYQTGDESKISVPILEAAKIPLDVNVLQLARNKKRA